MDEINEFFRQMLFLPPQASSMAREIDTLHYTVITVTMLGSSLVFIIALWFVIRYRAGKRRYEPTPRAAISVVLESVFIFATLGLFIILWQVGFAQYVKLETPPADTLDVYVTAKQWMWKFAYPEGSSSIAALYVPAGRPVKLIMTSRDVIHSFFVPDFRVKQDVIPGHYTTAWFEAKEPGTYQILCAEMCGVGHSTMRGAVVALRPADYARWLAGTDPLLARPRPLPSDNPFVVTDAAQPGHLTAMAAEGQIAAGRLGCFRCHTVDGTPHIGPTWVGLYGARRPFTDGTSLVADEAYLTESMMDPAKHIVAGFLPVMPSYQGILQPPEAAAVVEFIKALRHGPAGPSVPPAVPIPGVPTGIPDAGVSQ